VVPPVSLPIKNELTGFYVSGRYGVAVFALLATRVAEIVEKRGEKPNGTTKEE